MSDKKKPLAHSYKPGRSPVERPEKESRPTGSSDSEKAIQIDDHTGADLNFLKSIEVGPLTVRLALALADAVRAIRRDPVAFIGVTGENGLVPKKKGSRTAAGVAIAVVIYALAIFTIYASYSGRYRERPTPGAARKSEATFLASPPMPVMKAEPVLKAADVRTIKSQLTVPTQAPERSKTDLIKTAGPPRPIDQTESETGPTGQNSSVASSPHLPAGETASAVPASGAGPGVGAGNGNGTGTGSDAGRGAVASAGMNYNEVFSVNGVTTRPQILGRPVPAYTEEARRAQVEGAVKLSVVLNANGSVSDIKVARGLGYGLDEKAIEAARQLRFVPAQKDGHTVSVRVFLEFKFTLL